MSTYTDAQIEDAITAALREHDVEAVAGLIAVLALQNPNRAEEIRQTLLAGARLAAVPGGKETRNERDA